MGDHSEKKKMHILELSKDDNRLTGRYNSYVDLGTTPFAKKLKLTDEQTNGHWCSRCQGIWFGYTLETECPVCGNRYG